MSVLMPMLGFYGKFSVPEMHSYSLHINEGKSLKWNRRRRKRRLRIAKKSQLSFSDFEIQLLRDLAIDLGVPCNLMRARG